MTIQLSVTMRNNRLNQIASTIGATAILTLFSGTQPATTGSANSGSALVIMTSLPGVWLNAAANGSVSFTGTWQGTASGGATTVGHFRLFANNGTTCGMQGSVSTTGADLNLDNNSVNVGQLVSISSWVITSGNA